MAHPIWVGWADHHETNDGLVVHEGGGACNCPISAIAEVPTERHPRSDLPCDYGLGFEHRLLGNHVRKQRALLKPGFRRGVPPQRLPLYVAQ
jgi:hypothetical protein